MCVCVNRAESHRGGDKRKHLGPDRELAEERLRMYIIEKETEHIGEHRNVLIRM